MREPAAVSMVRAGHARKGWAWARILGRKQASGGVQPASFKTSFQMQQMHHLPPANVQRGPLAGAIISSPNGAPYEVPAGVLDAAVGAECLPVWGWACSAMEVTSNRDVVLRFQTPVGAELVTPVSIAGATGGSVIVELPIMAPQMTMRVDAAFPGGPALIRWALYLRVQE